MCKKEEIAESEMRKLLDSIKERCSCRSDCDYILLDNPNWRVVWKNDFDEECRKESQKLVERYMIVWGW